MYFVPEEQVRLFLGFCLHRTYKYSILIRCFSRDFCLLIPRYVISFFLTMVRGGFHATLICSVNIHKTLVVHSGDKWCLLDLANYLTDYFK